VILRTTIFLIINFIALALGGLFTSKGVPSEWYLSLLKAPWTPPGWVFGFAWSIIMICYAFYMGLLYKTSSKTTTIIILYLVQLVLNISWNPVFFKFHYVLLGFTVISLLTITVIFKLFFFYKAIKLKSFLILPYIIWLIIATSLNTYILIYN
jgi:tryptophan-rich sensory protein